MSGSARLFAVLLAGAALSGCASSGALTPAELQAAVARPGQTYGDYLNGHLALAKGERADAARYYARAVEAAPDDAAIRQRAFVTALLAGDVTRAAKLAPDADGADQRLGRLVRGVEALAGGKGAQAVSELSADGVGYPHRTAAALVRPFAQAASGDLEGAVGPLPPARDRLIPTFGELGRAQLLERAKRHDEAEAAYEAVLAQAPDNDLFLRLYGEFLERRGRRAEAVEQYQLGLKGETEDVELNAALARASARRGAAPPLASLQEGAAQGLLAAAANLVAEDHEELGLAYLRLALRLDPDRDEAWLLVGDLLSKAKDRDGARAAYARVRAGSGDYAAAQARTAWTWREDDDTAQALRVIEAAVRSQPGSESLQLAHAEVLRAAERHEEAAAILSTVIAARAEPDWRLHYLRGTTYERAGRWPEAEADLLKALELRPEEADILNYLGYAWADRGERLEQAFAMIEKAVALRPESGAIVDSLGWAHYRLGRYAEAVKHLERAVELEPADPTINDHLGDAYWRVGRRNEAQFQWRRVLTLDPDAKLKGEAETKLASGLGAPAPVATAAKP